MYKPTSNDPARGISVSLPVSIIKEIDTLVEKDKTKQTSRSSVLLGAYIAQKKGLNTQTLKK